MAIAHRAEGEASELHGRVIEWFRLGEPSVDEAPQVKVLLVELDPSQRQRWQEILEREGGLVVVGEEGH